MHDGITLEQQGLPTATIITDVFVKTAVAYTRLMGVPEFPYLVCPHPISRAHPSELEARARQLAPRVKRLLLEGTCDEPVE